MSLGESPTTNAGTGANRITAPPCKASADASPMHSRRNRNRNHYCLLKPRLFTTPGQSHFPRGKIRDSPPATLRELLRAYPRTCCRSTAILAVAQAGSLCYGFSDRLSAHGPQGLSRRSGASGEFCEEAFPVLGRSRRQPAQDAGSLGSGHRRIVGRDLVDVEQGH